MVRNPFSSKPRSSSGSYHLIGSLFLIALFVGSPASAAPHAFFADGTVGTDPFSVTGTYDCPNDPELCTTLTVRNWTFEGLFPSVSLSPFTVSQSPTNLTLPSRSDVTGMPMMDDPILWGGGDAGEDTGVVVGAVI